MGNSQSQEPGFKKFQSQYALIKQINDQNYGEGRILSERQTREQVFLKEFNITDQSQFQKQQKRFQTRKTQPHNNLINIIQIETFSQEDSQFCGTFYKFYVVFEYQSYNLDRMNMAIQENTMWIILSGCIDALSTLQHLNSSHQNLTLQTISLNQESKTVKICDTTMMNTQASFVSVLQERQTKGIYLSPLLTKALAEGNYTPRHNPYKSDVFTLGVLMINIGNLEPCDSCFNYPNGLVDLKELDKKLGFFQQQYSPQLTQLVEIMITQNEDARPDFIQLRQQIEGIEVPSVASQTTNNSVPSHQTLPLQPPQSYKQQIIDNNSILELQTLNIDYPDFVNIASAVSQIPSKTSKFDQNLGNEIGKNYDNNKHDIHDTHDIHDINHGKKQEYNIEKDMDRIRESYRLEINKNENVHLDMRKNPSVNNQQPQHQLHINTDMKNAVNPIQPQHQYNDSFQESKHSYLYDQNLNTAAKISQYQDDLTKRYSIAQKALDQSNIKNSYTNILLKSTVPLKETVRETYANGSKYEGEKLNQMRHGKGKFYYQDGGIYNGEWFENKMHGFGILYYSSGKPAYEGQWVDDKFEGRGVLYNEVPYELDGMFDPSDLDEIGEYWAQYEGGFHDDNKEGRGRLILSNGEIFEGLFVEDMACGSGSFTQLNGNVINGQWYQNRFQ